MTDGPGSRALRFRPATSVETNSSQGSCREPGRRDHGVSDQEQEGNEMDHCDPLDRFTGCLLGGAVGDALGAPVEFMKLAQILRQCGGRGARLCAGTRRGGRDHRRHADDAVHRRGADPLRGPVAVSCGFLAARDGGVRLSALAAHAGRAYPAGLEADSGGDGWLFGHRELHQRRAPGLTCVSALRAMRRWTRGDQQQQGLRRRDARRAGRPVRVAAGMDARAGVRDRHEVAGITHGHPTGELAGGARPS